MKNFFLRTLILLFIPLASFATADWKIIPEKSTLTFTATQNNAPVMGKFKSFTGNIHFDPAHLDTSHVKIIIDIGSIDTSYTEVADTLKKPDWFDVKLFPQAVFEAHQFIKTKENNYQANGTLTIRDKTMPIILLFNLEEYTTAHAHAVGAAMLKRTAFGLGKGEWASTSEVKDAVNINFDVQAMPG